MQIDTLFGTLENNVYAKVAMEYIKSKNKFIVQCAQDVNTIHCNCYSKISD